MTPDEYQNLCFRTVPPEQKFWNIENEVERKDSQMRLLLNATLGLAGEASEINETPTSDECGDAYWYAYVFMRAFEIPVFEPEKSAAKDPSTHRLLVNAGIISEWVKKLVFHNKPVEKCREIIVPTLKRYVDIVAALDENDYTETFEQNISKLRARYPDGFKKQN